MMNSKEGAKEKQLTFKELYLSIMVFNSWLKSQKLCLEAVVFPRNFVKLALFPGGAYKGHSHKLIDVITSREALLAGRLFTFTPRACNVLKIDSGLVGMASTGICPSYPLQKGEAKLAPFLRYHDLTDDQLIGLVKIIDGLPSVFNVKIYDLLNMKGVVKEQKKLWDKFFKAGGK